MFFFFFFQAEDGIRDVAVTGVQTCALPIWRPAPRQAGRDRSARGRRGRTRPRCRGGERGEDRRRRTRAARDRIAGTAPRALPPGPEGDARRGDERGGV